MATFTLTGNIAQITGASSTRVSTLVIRPTHPLVDLSQNVSFEPETRVPVVSGSVSVALPAGASPSGYGFRVSAPQIGLEWYVPEQAAGATVDLSDFTAIGGSIDPLITISDVEAVLAHGTMDDTAIAAQVNSGASATRAALDTWAEPFVRENELVHNVRDYGAVGDGAANDTAAVQAAIDAGGITYFPPGIYSCRGLIAPSNGMRLVGASPKGAGQSILVGGVGNTTPILTTNSGAIAYNWTITDLAFESAPGGGPCMAGEWALGVIRGCQFDQPNNGQSAITVSVWIDCSIEGYTVFNHTLAATVPTFKALSAVGDVAQISFENLRFNNSGNYNIWLEATSSQMIYNVRIANVNFEVPGGGAINLLSCRNVAIENCGMWDMAVAASKPLINASKSTGVDNRHITVRNYMRDASTAPSGYDMVFANTTGLIIDSCGHPTTNIQINAGSSTGSVINSPGATVDNAGNMSTEQFQTRTPTITGTGTALGNGTLTSRFRRSGNTVEFTIRWVLGSTSTVGSGGVTFSLSPVPANVNWHFGLTVQFTDVSAGGSTPGQALLTASGVQVFTSTYGAVNATAPFAWATGDVIQVSGSYEVAT